MAGPRIGRPDRLAALHDRTVDVRRVRRGGDAITRLVEAPVPTLPTPTPTPSRPADSRTLREHAARLADLLAPLPGALGEIGTRISQHCAVTGRDAELARVVESVRAHVQSVAPG
jgi:hypothetical protein